MYSVLIADDHAMIRAGCETARILAKMQMTSSADLTSYALRTG